MTDTNLLENQTASPGGLVAGAGGIAPPASDPGALTLVFDTETTGIPLWHKPSDLPEQPEIVEMAWELVAADGTVIDSYSEIVKISTPMTAELIGIHGITNEMAAEGVEPKDMLAAFFNAVERAAETAGHSVDFDLRMVRMAAARHLGQKWDCPTPTFDTMWEGAKALHVSKPKLTDLYRLLFHREMTGAHRARVDQQAARECMLELKSLGAVGRPAKEPKVRSGPAPMGDNGPPIEEPKAEEPATFEAIKKTIEDLYDTAKQYLDGDPIANDAQAADVGKLRDSIREAAKVAEKMRVAEVDPLNKAKDAIQARYNPLIQDKKGKAALAIDTCNSALAPYLKKLDEDQRAAAAAQQAEALSIAREARQTALDAADTGDLTKRESAEALIGEAKASLGAAKKLESAKPQVAGLKRAIGLKSVWSVEALHDAPKALAHYRETQPDALRAFLLEQARKDVAAGVREIPGVTIKEDRVPV